MSPCVTVATAARVLTQLRRDPRTLALLVLVPVVLVTLLRYVFAGSERVFERVGGPMLGIFPLVAMSSSPRSRCSASASPARSSGC